MTRTQRRAMFSVVAVLVAAPFLLAGGLAAFRAVHSPWPEPVPGVRLEPRIPFLAPGEPAPTNDALHFLHSISNIVFAESNRPAWPRDEYTRFSVDGLTAGPFPQLERAMTRAAPAWPLWDAAAKAPVDRVPEPDFDQIHPLAQSILLGRLTALRAARAIESGNWAGATTAWSASLSNGRYIRNYRTLVDHLTGIVVAEFAMRSMEQSLVLDHPTDAALWEMESMLALHDGNREPESEVLRGELQLALGSLRNVFEDSGDPFFVFGESLQVYRAAHVRVFLRLAGSNPQRTRKHIKAVYSHIIADVERSGSSDISELFDQRPRRFMFDDPLGGILIAMLLPSTGSLPRRVAEEDALLRGVRTLVAIERFRRANDGAAPESLGALVPAWLPAMPADPFDPNGGPLRYVPGRAPWLLYSVGTNGVDDTARAPDGAPSTNDMHFGRAHLDQLRTFLANTNASGG